MDGRIRLVEALRDHRRNDCREDDDGQPLHAVAYSVGGYYGPLLPGGRNREEQLPRILRKLGLHSAVQLVRFAALNDLLD